MSQQNEQFSREEKQWQYLINELFNIPGTHGSEGQQHFETPSDPNQKGYRQEI